MRTMLTLTIPVAAGNAAIAEGRLPQILQSTLEKLHPEAAYFFPNDAGDRQAIIFFDMKDPSDIPVIAEPLFAGLNAGVKFQPVMNAQDLQAGLGKLPR